MASPSSSPLVLPDAILAEILGLALSDTMPHREMVELCDTVGGRLVGTPGGEAGEKWAAQALRAACIRPTRLQKFRTDAWTRGTCSVDQIEPEARRLAALAHGFAPQDADVKAAVIDAGYGLKEDYERLGRKVRGQFALVREGAPPGRPRAHRSRKYALAAQAGAAGMLLTSGLSGQRPQTGMCGQREATIPSLGITQEDGEQIRRHLAAGRKVTLRVRLSNRIQEAEVANVLGDLPGAEHTRELVVVGGHLDSWDVAAGAMDNALGCAVVLGVAHTLARASRRPRRTVRFAMWAAEEIGILGSREYVRRATKELDRHVGYLNYDMPGDPKKLGLVGRPKELEVLEPLGEQLVGLGVCDPPSDSICMATDTRPFFLAGVPCLSAYGPHDSGAACYHSASDTVDKVDPGILRRAIACAAAMAFAVADAPQRPFARATRPEVEEALRGLGEYDGALEEHDLLLAPEA